MAENDLNELVTLLEDIPEFGLKAGQIGRVCSTWFSPRTRYEVEFSSPGLSDATRVLLLEYQFDGQGRKVKESVWKAAESSLAVQI